MKRFTTEAHYDPLKVMRARRARKRVRLMLKKIKGVGQAIPGRDVLERIARRRGWL